MDQSIKDPRDPKKITYPLATLVWTGLLMFITKLGACRQISFRFKSDEFLRHLNQLSQSQSEKVAHADTLAYLLERINPEGLRKLRVKIIQRLLRMRCLENFRLLDRYWLVAIDGTGCLRFNQKHCDGCLRRETKKGEIYFLHPVLEAKLVFANGLSLSLETEFILQEDGKEKQDCERNAFYRLAKRLKKLFPQLPFCFVLDSLYACGPVMALCQENRWKYLTTFKSGSMPAQFAWCQKMLKLQSKNKSTLKPSDGTIQKYQWANDVEYRAEKTTFNFLECLEKKANGKKTKFVWLTNINITTKNHPKLAGGARLRWKIENEGFNMQKNGGYRLEHAYSFNPQGMINWYLMLQIAHLINQLMEKGSLIKKIFNKGFGSIRNIAHQLLEDLRWRSFNPDWLNSKIQIRFLDSS